MVGSHHDQRLVVDPLLLEAPHEPANQAVHVAELEQVALLVVPGQELVVETRGGVHAGKRVGRPRPSPRARW